MDGQAYPLKVSWLPDEEFYALPADFPLVQSKCYHDGRVYGQDVSSGAAVATMRQLCEGRQNLRVLDLCCAPGQKLVALADGLPNDTTVVGVDVSPDRLAVCQKVLRKYWTPDNHQALQRIRLYCADGTNFALAAQDCTKLAWDSFVALSDTTAGRKRLNKSARRRQQKQLQSVMHWDWKSGTEDEDSLAIQLFDAVLVDAECSTDGSIKHVQKRRRLEWTEERLSELVQLQKGLAESGFRLVRKGGVMVYSTCSLETDQNEGVVTWLLDKMGPQAKLLSLSFPNAPSSVQPGSVRGTLRFWPSDNKNELTGGGFFLAAIQKQEMIDE